MPKRIYTDEERRERHRIASNNYSKKARLNPEVKAKDAARTRARYAILKNDPLYVEKVNARNLKDYHEKVKPFPEKMEERKLIARLKSEEKQKARLEKKISLQQLLGAKCVGCKITDPRLLDFDHIDPTKKTMMISQSLHRPIEQLLEELKNCQLLCPNCHRLKTLESKDNDAYKNREYRNSYRTYFKPLKA